MRIPISQDVRPDKLRTHVALLCSLSWHTCDVNSKGRMHIASYCLLFPGHALCPLFLLSIFLVVKLRKVGMLMVQSALSVYRSVQHSVSQSACRFVPRHTLSAITSAQKIEGAAKKAERAESALSALAALA